MTARTWEPWHLVGESSDPVPADHFDINDLAGDMRQRARDARDMRKLLETLSDLDDWRGKAAHEFSHRAKEVVGNLEKVEDRYDAVADALTWWAGPVETARTATSKAVNDAQDADTRIRSNPLPTGDELTEAQELQKERHEKAQDDLVAARKDLETAMGNLDDAARTAKDKIEDAAGKWDDGWTGNIKGWVRDNADIIDILCKVLEVVAVVLAVVALACAILLTGGVALWILVAVGGLLLASRAALVWADTGKATWEDVFWDAAGLALTLVGGKLTAKAIQGMKGLVPAVAGRLSSSAKQASIIRQAGNLGRYKGALKIKNMQGWAGKITRVADADAAKWADDFAQGIHSIKGTRFQALLQQDTSLSKLSAQMRQLRSVVNSDEYWKLVDIEFKAMWATGTNAANTVIQGWQMPNPVHSVSDFVHYGPFSGRGA